MIPQDNYDQAIKSLEGICILLAGGYYEPKSERDLALFDQLYPILNQHKENHDPHHNPHSNLLDNHSPNLVPGQK